MNRDLVICETPLDVADAAADLIIESQHTALAERGIFRIAFSGGATPKLLYELLGGDDYRAEIDWPNWEIFWSDERCVPPDSAASNFHMANLTLLHKVPVGELFRMLGEHPNPQEAADDYARTLRSRFQPGVPEFDVILLGMGSDGHTASLFPGNAALTSDKLIEAVEVEQQIRRRITFTLNLINHAHRVIFMICGAEKAARVKEIVDGSNTYPAARVNPPDGENIWLLDHAAATLIR